MHMTVLTFYSFPRENFHLTVVRLCLFSRFSIFIIFVGTNPCIRNHILSLFYGFQAFQAIAFYCIAIPVSFCLVRFCLFSFIHHSTFGIECRKWNVAYKTTIITGIVGASNEIARWTKNKNEWGKSGKRRRGRRKMFQAKDCGESLFYTLTNNLH